jgi:DNA-binding transcriptional regulator YiaG
MLESNKDAKPDISLKIRALREDMGLERKKFAAILSRGGVKGYGIRTIASWEGGERTPEPYKVARIIRICRETHPDAVRLHFPSASIQAYSEVESPPPDYDKPEKGDWEQIAGEWRQIAEERKQKIAELQKIIDSGKIR